MSDTPTTPATQTANVDDRLVKARTARRSGAQPSSASVDQLLAKARLNRPEAEIAKICQRLATMPETHRRTYLAAIAGRSKSAAIKSFCAMCTGWDREAVRCCTDPTCPLYPYRPFTGGVRHE